MHKIATLLLPLVLALPVTAAEDRFDPVARAKTIAPFLDAQTIALAHVDMTRVDVERLAAMLTDIAHLAAEEVTPFKQAAQPWIADFKKAGGKEIYLVASADDLPQHLSMVVPIEGAGNAGSLLQLLASPKSTELAQFRHFPFGIETIEKVDRAIFAGSKAALARFRAGKPAPRPEVVQAFAAAGDTAGQLLLLPTADIRRAIEDVMPTLPKAVGGGPSTTLTHGFLWAAIGVDGPPKASLRLVIQSQDAAAAKSFSTLLPKVYKALGQEKELFLFVPDVDKILTELTPAVATDRLTLTFDPGAPDTARLLAALGPFLTQKLRRDQCADNLRHIGIALHNYHDVNGRFPAQANYDLEGKPLLSWRVLLLPHLGEEKLYKEFHLNEPWDSEHNKQLIARMPQVYRCPSMRWSLKNKTTYLAPVSESAMFTGAREGVPIKDVEDGTSNTIFIVDTSDDHAVIWTKPQDLKLDPKNPGQGLFGHHGGSGVVLFVDGAVHFLPNTIDHATLLALFTRKGGEAVNFP